jgi:hypothetical protein
MHQRLAHVGAATLPGGVEHLADGGLDALVGVLNRTDKEGPSP